MCEALCLVPTSGKERSGGFGRAHAFLLSEDDTVNNKSTLVLLSEIPLGGVQKGNPFICGGLLTRSDFQKVGHTAFGRGEEISWENVKVTLHIIELSHLGLVGSIKFVKHLPVSNRPSWVDFPRKHKDTQKDVSVWIKHSGP